MNQELALWAGFRLFVSLDARAGSQAVPEQTAHHRADFPTSLNYGSIIIGAKMLLSEVIKVPVAALTLIVFILLIWVIVSLLWPRGGI